jgi:hypothetical protein
MGKRLLNRIEAMQRNIKIKLDYKKLRKKYCSADCNDILAIKYNLAYDTIQEIIFRK